MIHPQTTPTDPAVAEARRHAEDAWRARGEHNGFMLLMRRVKASVPRQLGRGHSVETIRATWTRVVESECARLGIDAEGRTRILDVVHGAIDCEIGAAAGTTGQEGDR